MSRATDLVVIVCTILGTGAALAEFLRRALKAREVRFRYAVQQIVNASISDVLARQVAFEDRVGKHLDRQDRALDALRRKLDRR
jgi:hypothetical protein